MVKWVKTGEITDIKNAKLISYYQRLIMPIKNLPGINGNLPMYSGTYKRLFWFYHVLSSTYIWFFLGGLIDKIGQDCQKPVCCF